MTIPAKGKFRVQVGPKPANTITYPVQFNPTELQFDKQVQMAEIGIPGLDAPLQQFVRGNAEKLTLELFCDSTDKGMGIGAQSVTKETDKYYQLVKMIPTLHAPPIVTFIWNDQFPGNEVGKAWGGSQRRTSFTGVAESVRSRFTLFSPEGIPLRATVNLVLREWRPIEQQLGKQNPSSPDRSHAHVLQRGETLSAVAGDYYERAGEWRAIADENGIEDPRRLAAGLRLTVPSIR
ncbi:LysM peptidoglycan-binding domain-containing protein [Cupriavidus sp. UYPR2.512]|uniref:CIS tube protein n=1 Tax=Cupriavidus sp. UYPR2.512 TaxID=1080187 RepID=UPI00036A74DC|nr:LysM peptidoglycan-binding domain-containing protein [Cupriavidus sp. UYPR2.512]UIF91174.1 LysM peptidoglycan-binding domain-containing protein [Cupriavidus necator]